MFSRIAKKQKTYLKVLLLHYKWKLVPIPENILNWILLFRVLVNFSCQLVIEQICLKEFQLWDSLDQIGLWIYLWDISSNDCLCEEAKPTVDGTLPSEEALGYQS